MASMFTPRLDPGRLLPPQSEAQNIELCAGALRILRGGRRKEGLPAIMLIHGGGSDNSSISWYRLFPELSQMSEVWALDLPGFGGSIDVNPVGGPSAMASVVANAMSNIDAGPMLVMGVSMGGDVALNLALNYPGHVSGLVLIAPGGLVPVFKNTAAQYFAWLTAQGPDWILLSSARLANRFVKTALRAMVEDVDAIPNEVIEEFVREARHPQAGIGYLRYNQAVLGRKAMINDLSDRVGQISCPTLFFHGEADRLVDPEGSRRAAQRMPNAVLHTVPNCGHWAQLEQHDLFISTMKRFLVEQQFASQGARQHD